MSWRPVSVLVVIVAAIIFVLPTIRPGMWPHKKINLGLDLQGGLHLVLDVDTDKAVEDTIERLAQELRPSLRKERVRVHSIGRLENNRIAIKVEGEENITNFNKLLDAEYKDIRLAGTSELGGMKTFALELPEDEAENIKRLAAEQALETIRNRIDQFGVSEPDIRHQGEKRILIQLPGIKDTKRAKELIGKTALLEFKLLDEAGDIGAALKGDVPPGTQLLYEIKEDATTI